MNPNNQAMKKRFRGYLPVVIDVETGGFDPQKDALLEIAAVAIDINPEGLLEPSEHHHEHVLPFDGSHLCPKALAFTGIDPYHPFRFAKTEAQALNDLFRFIKTQTKRHQCQRAVLVGHNAHFDLAFVTAAIERNAIQRSPLHAFTCFDTATLSAVALGQTVLARALHAAKIEFDPKEAHSALYDARITAELFCHLSNKWPSPSQP